MSAPPKGVEEPVGTVAELARYPVKSMVGEHPPELQLEPRGVVGDRCWAVYTADGGIGSGKTTRRFRRLDGLLSCSARLDGDIPAIEMPGGDVLRCDDPAAGERLSALVGQPVVLGREGDVDHHDDSPVHLITTAGLRRLSSLLGGPVDARRFRANLVLDVEGDDFVEDGWMGRALHLGDEVVLRLDAPMPRCVMVGLPQRDLERDPRVLKALGAAHQVEFGLQAHVVQGGTVRRGDVAALR